MSIVVQFLLLLSKKPLELAQWPFRLLIGMTAFVAGPATAAQSYQPPAGIPMPAFGVTENVRDVYGSDQFHTHYIDNTHPTATDTNNPKGSAAKPRRTIPVELRAGDVVLIKGGTYVPTGDRFHIIANGSRDRPIFIRGTDPSNKPVLTKPIHVSDAQWLVIENLRIQTKTGGLEIRPTLPRPSNIHHVAIRQCEMIGNGKFKSGQTFGVGSSIVLPAVRDIVFYRNVSHDAGKWDAEKEDDTHSFAVGSNVQNAWILDNTAFRSGGDGVQVAHAALYSTHHIFIGRNKFYQHRENGVDLKQANDVIVSENTIYRHWPTSSSSGEGIVVHYDPRRIWIIFNTVTESEFGIVTTGSQETYIVGNVISGMRQTRVTHKPESPYVSGAAIHARNARQVYVLNNTLHDYVAGVQIGKGGSAIIQNNIFSGRSVAAGYDINHESDPKESVMDHNLFDPGSGNERIRWGRQSGLTLKQFRQHAPDQGRNAKSGNAQFIDAPGRNFRLAVGSAARNAGLEMRDAPYSTFASLYGLDILRDITGRKRPSGKNWNLGAYQSDSVPTGKP